MGETTTNYSFKKRNLGHPVQDDDIGDNLDLIDAAIKAREDEIDALEALADGKIIVGNGEGVAADVAMSGDITIANTGATTIGVDKVLKTMIHGDIAGDGLVQAAGGELDVNPDGSTVELSGDALRVKDLGITIAKLEAALQKGVLSVGPILQADALNLTVYFPFKVTINKVRSFLLVVLATANSVITMKKHDGTSMTDGVLTITSTGSVGDEDSCSPSAENVIAAGEKMTLAIDGGASAGEALFFIEYTRTP